MKEEDCYSARQKPSGGPFNLSILVVYLRKKKKEKQLKYWNYDQSHWQERKESL